MLKDGPISRAFIRVSIILLRSVAPLSTAYCVARLVGWRPNVPLGLLRTADVYAGAEAAFYFFIYIPRKWWLNRPATPRTPILSRPLRKKFFMKTWEDTPEPRRYVSLWFKGVPIEALCREDVKDWISWRMWNNMDRSLVDEDELDEYLTHAETVLDWRFPDGRSGNSSMAVTFEPLRTMHRPLVWYLCFIGGADLQMCGTMLYYGFRFYSSGLSRLLSSLPFRPLALLTLRRSPSTHFAYWYLPHTSPDHLPILFIHGIGVGLHFYLNFFKDFLAKSGLKGVGIIAIEILPISSRITQPVLHQEETAREIEKILIKHGWSRCVVISHSYGSVFATHMLHDASASSMIGPMIFVDPVAFSFHPPEVPWNFLRRQPTTASEIQLQYFASTDPDVAYTLTRRFVWPDNSLWREDVEERAKGEAGYGRRCTVALAGKDIITDTNTLGCYLTRRQVDGEAWYQQKDALQDDWKESSWTGDEPLEVIWFPDLNHSEAFDDAKDRQVLLQVLQKYSRDGGATVSAGAS